jgi:hypothetical protein
MITRSQLEKVAFYLLMSILGPLLTSLVVALAQAESNHFCREGLQRIVSEFENLAFYEATASSIIKGMPLIEKNPVMDELAAAYWVSSPQYGGDDAYYAQMELLLLDSEGGGESLFQELYRRDLAEIAPMLSSRLSQMIQGGLIHGQYQGLLVEAKQRMALQWDNLSQFSKICVRNPQVEQCLKQNLSDYFIEVAPKMQKFADNLFLNSLPSHLNFNFASLFAEKWKTRVFGDRVPSPRILNSCKFNNELDNKFDFETNVQVPITVNDFKNALLSPSFDPIEYLAKTYEEMTTKTKKFIALAPNFMIWNVGESLGTSTSSVASHRKD